MSSISSSQSTPAWGENRIDADLCSSSSSTLDTTLQSDESLAEQIRSLTIHNHACLIYDNIDDQFAAVAPFIALGLSRGEKCIYIADDNSVADVELALQQRGVDVARAVADGHLTIATKRDAYLRHGTFDPDSMISFLRETTEQSTADSYSALRVTGEMTWALGDAPGAERLLEYEAKLNRFFPDNYCLAICQYNQSRFTAEIITDVIRTHPLVIYRRRVCSNPFYIPPEEYLTRSSAEREASRLLSEMVEREQVQIALRESEGKYRALFEQAPDTILLIQCETGDVAEFNTRSHETLGYTRDEFAKLRLSEFDINVVPGEEIDVVRKIAGTGHLAYETKHRRKSGEIRDVIVQTRTIDTPHGRQIVMLCTDVTEQRTAEENLRDSEELLSDMSEIASVGGWEHDLVTGGARWTKGTYAIVGLDETERIPGPEEHLQYYPPEDREILQRAYENAVRTGESFDLELRCNVRKSDTIWARVIGRPVFQDGRCVRMRGTFQDVTPRKQAEEDLRRQRDFAESLIQTAQFVVLVLDVDGKIIKFNRYMERLSGYSIDEVQGKDWFTTFLPPCHYDAIRTLFQKSICEVNALGNVNPIVTKDGTLRQIEWYDHTLRDGDGNVIGIVATGQDVTEKLKTEQELARHRENLEELVEQRTEELAAAQRELLTKERLATLGQLTATVSHELRNPLGTIRSSVYSARERVGQSDPALTSILERAERNIIRCDRIIDELLDYTRTRQIAPVEVNIDDWIGQCLDEYAIPEEITPTRRLNTGQNLPVDRERLRRCLINLVSNACQAMQEQEPSTGELIVETDVLNDRLEIRISDNGPGIQPDQLTHVFEPLYSTKGFGVGLGLPIVKQIAEAHGGGISMESTPGEGTTATLWIPLQESR